MGRPFQVVDGVEEALVEQSREFLEFCEVWGRAPDVLEGWMFGEGRFDDKGHIFLVLFFVFEGLESGFLVEGSEGVGSLDASQLHGILL